MIVCWRLEEVMRNHEIFAVSDADPILIISCLLTDMAHDSKQSVGCMLIDRRASGDIKKP